MENMGGKSNVELKKAPERSTMGNTTYATRERHINV
jgi:hypothetical protein